jgi:hypothetical protein
MSNRLPNAQKVRMAHFAALPLQARSANWVKVKKPNAPAVAREAEEDWR